MTAVPPAPTGARPSGPRPDVLALVIGTATDIGKTWAGGQVLAELVRRGTTVAARKPAQSFDPGDPHPTDAAVLGGASGEAPEVVCPPHRWYGVAYAPPMAADHLGLPVPSLDDLIAELAWPEPAVELGWVETVGGPRSPIGADGDAVTLTARLDPDVVVLVADAGLGTVNAVVLSLAPFTGRRCVVLLNRYDEADDLHRRNRAWLVDQHGLEVVTTPDALADAVLA